MKSSSTRLGMLGAVQGLAWLLFLAAGRADAAGISIVNVSSTGASTSALAVGDVLTVDLVANNDTHLDIYGLELVAFGYDVDANGVADDGLRMVSVSTIGSIFNSVAVPSVGSFGGLDNFAASWTYWETINRPYQLPASELFTVFFRGGSLSPSTGDGTLDVGIGGRLIRDGDVHFRISFQATSVLDTRSIDLTFGVSYGESAPIWGVSGPRPADGVIGTGGIFLPFENDTLRLAILADPGSAGGAGAASGAVGAVPEPAAALLFAAGLLTARLAGRR
jgi:hypothetical protein